MVKRAHVVTGGGFAAMGLALAGAVERYLDAQTRAMELGAKAAEATAAVAVKSEQCGAIQQSLDTTLRIIETVCNR
jgi:hypothetical protein